MAIQQTHALQALTSLNINQFINANYGPFAAFRRSLKMFERCFYHHRGFNNAMYNQMGTEYFDAMAELYEVQNHPNLAQALDKSNIHAQIMTDESRVRAGVTQLDVPVPNCAGRVRIQFEHIIGLNMSTVYLNMSRTEQRNCSNEVNIRVNDLQMAVDNNRSIVVTYNELVTGSHGWQNFPPFVIPYRQLHAEGFHQWLTFGTRRILFCVELSSRESATQVQYANNFHLQTIIYAIRRRLTQFRSLPANNMSHIHMPSVNREVTYERGLTDPTTREAFWGTEYDPADNDNILGPVDHIDLQIGFNFGEELVSQELCTCGEFCNLNAFFRYNPIYRFVLVQHNRHYLRNKTTVAAMYLLAITKLLPTVVTPPRTPLISLLYSANTQLITNRYKIRNSNTLTIDFNANNFEGRRMEGAVYRVLKDLNIANLSSFTNARIPFSADSFYYINIFYEILSSLHYHIGTQRVFVPHNRRSDWDKAFDNVCRNYFYKYIRLSFSRVLTLQPENDYLFTKDFEWSSKSAQHECQTNQLTRWEHLHSLANQFNVQFQVWPFINLINKIWQSLTLYKPLTDVHTTLAIQAESKFFIKICGLLEQTVNNQNFASNRIELSPLPLVELDNVRVQLNSFYKLKTYSRVFLIQKYFCRAYLHKYNYVSTAQNKVVFTELAHIWRIAWIESMTFSPTQLFNINNNFRAYIRDFYSRCWGQSTHITLYNQPLPPVAPGVVPVVQPPFTSAQLMDSVFNEYGKRQYWETNNGETTAAFVAPFTHFNDTIQASITDANNVFQNQIISSMTTLRGFQAQNEQNTPEIDKQYVIVMDELVYWTMRAVCFMIVKTVATNLKTVCDQEIDLLVKSDRQFSLSKPGFVNLFQVRDRALQAIDDLDVRYIAFSDPFDNIATTFCETKEIIKGLYKDLFKKLVTNWVNEVNYIRGNNFANSHRVMVFHFISGVAFMYCFNNDNRKLVMRMRKRLDRYTAPPFANPLQAILSTIWQSCKLTWLENIDPQQLLKPFTAPHWQPFTQPLSAPFAAMNFTNILTLANTTI